MRLAITKCHGSGNDFPLIDARGLTLDDASWAAVARLLADRTGSVGSDGLLLMTQGGDGALAGFRMFNADGSEAETCLNGVRCVARAAFSAADVAEGVLQLRQSQVAVARGADLAPGVFTVRETAGPAVLDLAAWPLHGAGAQLIDGIVPPLHSQRRFTAVAMPNPHLVSFVDVVDEAELVALGECCEAAPDWLPRRANVSFAEVRGDDLFVRTFERGVGLTDACGSAMAASTYAAGLTGRTAWGREITVFNRGGLVRASANADGMVTLSGNATWEWAGVAEVDLSAGRVTLEVRERFAAETAAWDAAVRALG